jgi:hypothetical protein
MRALILTALFLLSSLVQARTFDTYGAVPFLSLSKGFGNKYSLSFYHSDTFNLTKRTFEKKNYPSRDIQAYFQTAINYRYLPNISLSLGHIYQRNNPLDVDFSNEHRIFEQATYSHARKAFQFTHRVRFEQRFIDERDAHEFKTRLRYQIGFNVPLDGRQLDPGEWYFNTYNEFYFSTTGDRNAFFSDDWFYAGFGYQTTDWGRLEAGPICQYSVINRDKDYRSFYGLQFGWILKFK